MPTSSQKPQMWLETCHLLVDTKTGWGRPALLYMLLNLIATLVNVPLHQTIKKAFSLWEKTPKELRVPIEEALPQPEFILFILASLLSLLASFLFTYYFSLFFLHAKGTFPVPRMNIRTFGRSFLKQVQVFTLLILSLIPIIIGLSFITTITQSNTKDSTVSLGILSGALILYLALRLKFFLPLCYLKARDVFKDSWRLTDKNILALLGNSLALIIPLFLFSVTLQSCVHFVFPAPSEPLEDATTILQGLPLLMSAFFASITSSISLVCLMAFDAVAIARFYSSKKEADPTFTLTLPKA